MLDDGLSHHSKKLQPPFSYNNITASVLTDNIT